MNVYTDNNLTPQPWVKDALCAQTDPDAFFPENSQSTLPARRTCARCPVVAECLAYALENHITEGFWGSTSPRQRRKLRRTA